MEIQNDYAYTHNPARYAKDCIAVHCLSIGEGFFSKSQAMTLAECVKARYSHREKAYIMRPSQFKRYQGLIEIRAEGCPITRKVIKP